MCSMITAILRTTIAKVNLTKQGLTDTPQAISTMAIGQVDANFTVFDTQFLLQINVRHYHDMMFIFFLTNKLNDNNII